MKVYYKKQSQRQPKNPFYTIINDDYQKALVGELDYVHDYITENLSYWIFEGNDIEREMADWLLTIPQKNMYGKAQRGTKDGVHNSPLSALSGAVNKLRKGKPGQADLSKNVVNNLTRVIDKLSEYDSKKFRKVEWIEAQEGDEDKPSIHAVRKKLGGNTFNNMFEIQTSG